MIDTPSRPDLYVAEGPPVLDTLMRALWPILGAAALAGVGTYLITSNEPRVYQASSAMISTASGASADLGGPVTLGALPANALAQALRAPAVVQNVIAQLQTSGLPANDITSISADLRQEQTSGAFEKLQIRADGQTNSANAGVYVVSAKAGTPAGARVLANAAVTALQDWDVDRINKRVQRSLASLDRQLKALDTETPNTDIYSQAYQDTRTRLYQQRSLLAGAGPSSSLDVLAEATDPSAPVSPRPLRSALLSALLALLAAAGLALLLGGLRWRVPAGRAPVRSRSTS